MIGRRLFFALLLLLAAGIARAAAPSMILDIYDEEVDADYESGVVGHFLSLGRVALVRIDEPSSGTELWVTDGTDAGTRPLFDRCPGNCSTGVTLVDAIDNVGLFSMFENGTRALWRTDGTRPGTSPILTGRSPCNESSARIGRSLLLSMSDGSDVYAPCELWKTDGSAAGTVRVAEINPAWLIGAGSRAFFTRSGEEGGELWTTDGTPEGTVRLHVWPLAMPSHLTAIGNRLFLIAPQDGLELWTSDGTPAGTRPVTQFGAADPFVQRSEYNRTYVLQALDGNLYFLANDGTSGRELWRSDGTVAGTRPVTSFAGSSPFLGLEKWRVEKLGERLVFAANDGTSGNRLWTSNGQPESTAAVAGCPGGCPEIAPEAEMVRQGSQIAFVGHREKSELWASNGTGAGTRRLFRASREEGVGRLVPLLGRVFFLGDTDEVAALHATDKKLTAVEDLTRLGFSSWGFPAPPVALGNIGLFALPKDSSRSELWRSDGTRAGTFRVTRIGQNGYSSSPHELVPAGDAIRFLAAGGLWTSRGTAETTTLLEEIGNADQLEPLGSLTLLDVYGALWRSDGTPEGTFELASPDQGDPDVAMIVSLTNGRAVVGMRAFDSYSVWATDASAAGTREIFAMPEGFAYLNDIAGAGREAFFVTTTTSHEDRLWVTDGTAAGTQPVTPLSYPRSIEIPIEVARLGSLVLFSGDNDQHGIELWRTDGTVPGTYPLAEERLSDPDTFTLHQGSLYFFARAHEEGGLGLWRTNGTEAGTVLLAAWRSGQSFRANQLVPLGNLLFFAVGGADGAELWRTDGTATGTVQVRDIAPGALSSNPRPLVALGDRLYFGAHDQDHGTELWESDGTAAGTRLVQDIAPGVAASNPQELTVAGGRLYFTADDGVHGREPWVYAPGGAGCVPSEFVLCLGGRFKVEADWRDFEGGSGRGRAVSLTSDTGYFWFFEPSNVEVILKALDGRGINGHHWVFYGALSSVEYTLTVTDTQTGAARRYINPPNRLGSVADTQAFGPLGASAAGTITLGPSPMVGEAIVSSRISSGFGFEKAACAPSSTRLCLNNGRFAVEARWKAQGNSGTGKAVALPGGDTGYFWFFDASNVEVVLKVLDGRPLNGKFWVFYGALSNVEYTLTVTDTVTGTVKTYTNPNGRLASVADTGAF